MSITITISCAPCMCTTAAQLCQAYDAGECCRNVHPDPAWSKAASKVCVDLGGGTGSASSIMNVVDSF